MRPACRQTGIPSVSADFSSRKDTETCLSSWVQWSCGPLGLASGGLGGLATLEPAPQNCGSAAADFFSRKDAEPQRNSCQFFAPSLLCELFFFFFLFAKTYRPACCRQAQRNYGLLGMTSGGLCGLASLRDL